MRSLAKLRSWLERLFYGRYGIDPFYKFQLTVWLVLAVLYLFIQHPLLLLLQAPSWFGCFSGYFPRTFIREPEREKYLACKRKVIQFFKRHAESDQNQKTKVYKKCPKCRQILCLPKKKGTHTVHCPECGERFDIKI